MEETGSHAIHSDMPPDAACIRDQSGNTFSALFRLKKILHQSQSSFQEIIVAETEDLGRALFLDGIFNVSPVMEAFYHEPMAHIPMAMTAGSGIRAMIIGGGDFGLASHLLKHDRLSSLILCELDPDVLAVSRRFYPEWAACETDERISVKVKNGLDLLEELPPGGLDVLVVDSTDPFLGDAALISEAFYERAERALSPGGVLMQIIADAVIYPDVWRRVLPVVHERFPRLMPLFLPIPFYATGEWGLLLAGKQESRLNPDRITAAFLEEIGGVDTITPARARGWASLAPRTRRVLGPPFFEERSL